MLLTQKLIELNLDIIFPVLIQVLTVVLMEVLTQALIADGIVDGTVVTLVTVVFAVIIIVTSGVQVSNLEDLDGAVVVLDFLHNVDFRKENICIKKVELKVFLL